MSICTYSYTTEELAKLLYDATIEWGADATNLETYDDALAFAETLKEDGDVWLTELTPEDDDFYETCEKLNVLDATERVYTFVKGNAGSICFADDINPLDDEKLKKLLVGALCTFNADTFLIEDDELAREVAERFIKEGDMINVVKGDDDWYDCLAKLDLTGWNNPRGIYKSACGCFCLHWDED